MLHPAGSSFRFLAGSRLRLDFSRSTKAEVVPWKLLSLDLQRISSLSVVLPLTKRSGLYL